MCRPVIAMVALGPGHRDFSLCAGECYLDEAQHGKMQICAIPMPDDLLDFLEQCVSIDQLVIVGAGNTVLTHELTTAKAAKVMRNSNASVIFVRGDTDL